MTPIAEMVRRMLEKGVAHDAIVMAVEGAEQALIDSVSTRHQVDTAAEKRRAWDREYRRNKRVNPPDSTRHPPDIHSASLSKEENIEIKDPEREATQRRVHPTRGQRLPDDWQPTAQDRVTANELIGSDAARSELEKFRDHWRQQPGSKGVKLDWNAAWRNWIRRAAEYRGGMNGNRVGNQSASGHDAILAVAARKARELDRNDAMAGAAGAPGFAFGDGFDAPGQSGHRGAAEAGGDDRQGHKPDAQRVREGEIIPPDKNAAGFPGRRQFV